MAFLLFGPHGCIQTPPEQQVFMSDQDIKRTEKEKSRLGLQVHAIMLFFNRTDMNATFSVSKTAQSKSCMQLLSTNHGRAPKTPNKLHVRELLRASHLDSGSSWTVHLDGQTTVAQ